MTRITITLDNQAAAWVRRRAAARNMSLSRYVGEILREKMRHSQGYQKAYKAFLAEKPLRLKGPGERQLTREEANDRAALRRR